MIRVLLAEDMHMVRGALVALLNLEDDIEVVAEVSSGDKIMPMARRWQPDVAVIDIDLPVVDGLTVAAQMREELPPIKTLILTSLGQPGTLHRALSAKVSGFILKDAPPSQLADAIRDVVAGKRVVDSQLAPGRVGPGRVSAYRAGTGRAAVGRSRFQRHGDRRPALPVRGHGTQLPDVDRHEARRPQSTGRRSHRPRGRLAVMGPARDGSYSGRVVFRIGGIR